MGQINEQVGLEANHSQRAVGLAAGRRIRTRAVNYTHVG